MTYPEFYEYLKTIPAMKRRVLQHMINGYTVREIAEFLGIGESTIYLWRVKDPHYAEAWKFAMFESGPVIEQIGFSCAKMALTNPKYSNILIHMLKSRMRDVYGDQITQNIQTTKEIDLTPGSDDLPDGDTEIDEEI